MDDTKWTVAEDAWTSNNGGNLEYTISGLSQGTSYDVQVRAENAEGTSGWSTSVAGMTVANVAPVIASISPITVAENSTAAIVTVTVRQMRIAMTTSRVIALLLLQMGHSSLLCQRLVY